MNAHGLEAHPFLSLAASKSEKDHAQPDDACSVMYLPSLIVRSSGISSSSLLRSIYLEGGQSTELEYQLFSIILYSLLTLSTRAVHDVMMWNTNSKITKP